MSQVKQIRADMREGKMGETTPYVQSLFQFRKLPKAQRQAAAAMYLERNGSPPDVTKSDVLQELFIIGDELRSR